MALIGIRGTETVHKLDKDGEQHGALNIGKGHVLVVQDQFGNIQFISEPGLIIDFLKNHPIEPPRPMKSEELELFQKTTPFSPFDEPEVNDSNQTPVFQILGLIDYTDPEDPYFYSANEDGDNLFGSYYTPGEEDNNQNGDEDNYIPVIPDPPPLLPQHCS